MSILDPLFDAVAWVIMRIHAVLSVPFGASSGWAWGLSIVILVMLMRALMVPLFVKQVKSQRKMQSHMPQLQEIRKRYKNDKQRLNEETMKFYKENGINPLGGCLPLIAQLPLFYSLFYVLRAIAEWTPGKTPEYGLTESVVESARAAHIFGATLADRFLFPIAGESWASRIVILLFVLVSASTTFMTMRQSSKRGMMQQGPVDPDNPAANMQKYMMYIAPFFALSGLYWQFGLVIYWVTTNVWTLGQQHILFRNLPIVGSATVDAAAAPAPSGNGAASGRASASKAAASKTSTTRTGTSGAGASGAGASRTSTSKTGTSSASSKTSGAKTSGAPGKSTAAGRTTTSANPVTSNAGANGATGTGGTLGGLLKFGRNKAEPEPVTAAQQTKVVRQQPVRQTRSKRSGKR